MSRDRWLFVFAASSALAEVLQFLGIKMPVTASWMDWRTLTPLLFVLSFGLSAYGFFRCVKRDRDAQKAVRAPAEPALTGRERHIASETRQTFHSLTWAQKIALCVIYHWPGLFAGEFIRRLAEMGFAEPNEKLLVPLTATNLVERTATHELHPSRSQVIARTVEKLIEESGMDSHLGAE